jgi:hypothetical protein
MPCSSVCATTTMWSIWVFKPFALAILSIV